MILRKDSNLNLARTAGMLSGASRVALMLLMTLLLTMTAQTAWAQDDTNTRETGDLKVTNTVVSDLAADATVEFEFTVTLDDTTISGTYGGMTFADGIATFTLKGGESKTAEGLPTDLTYTVTQADATGFQLTGKTGDTGTISTTASEVVFTNTRETGDLKLTNIVVSDLAADAEVEFTFTVTLSDTTIDGTYGGMTFADGIATVTLKGGEYKTATGLPTTVEYTVTQADAEGFVLSGKTGDEGAIGATLSEAVFTNTRETGDLVVSNTVVSNLSADADAVFTFTVTLSDTTISGTYGDMDFEDGVATFTLKGGESAEATGLPTDLTYTVTQADAEGFVLSGKTGDEGTISKTQSVAEFTNTRKVGDLTVSNTVLSSDANAEFNFTVRIDGISDKTYGENETTGMTFANGVATFTLKNGESKTATGLPTTVGYTVEQAEYVGDCSYATTPVDEQTGKYMVTGTVTNLAVTTVAFKNVQKANANIDIVWNDGGSTSGRPGSLTATLKANNIPQDTKTLTADNLVPNTNVWQVSVSELPGYDENDAPVTYSWSVDTPEGYLLTDSDIDTNVDVNASYTFTKAISPELKVVWDDNDDQDGVRPTSLTVTLSNCTDPETITLSEDNNWTTTVNNLPMYNGDDPIAYNWTVVKVDDEGASVPTGYSPNKVTEDAITTLTYSYTPGETSVMANVVWSDGNNTEGFRPESVTVKLMNGEEIGSVSLNASNNWSYTWTGLPTHEGGEAITYTVTEDAVDNYSTTIEGFTITNSRTVEMTTATLKIFWLDDTNKYGVRPASLNAKLSDGTNETPYTINENLLNGTYFSFIVDDLQKYKNGREIVYSLTITDEIDCYEQTGLDKNGNTTSYTMHLMTMGNCGQTGSEAALKWDYYTAEKTLNIIGTGPMMYYNSVLNDDQSYSNGAPWKAFANEIEHVVISDGITYVGSNTFAHCPHISSVTLPTDQQLYEIGPGAFGDCTGLTSIDLPMSVNKIYEGAFAGCSNLATVSIGYGDPGTFTLGSEVFPVTTTILVPESAYENYINEKAINGNQEEINNPFYVYKNKIAPATRTFFANGTNTWMTWCDKYAWTLPEGCTAYTISDVSGSTVTLSDALTTIPAYTPVLIQRDANATAPVTAAFSAVGTVPDSGYDSATGIASTTDTEGCTFYGTTTDLATIPEANYSAGLTYVLYGDKFLKSDNNSGIAANRCWLKLEAGGGTSGARLLSIVIDDNPTAIDNVQWSMVNGQSDSWYTIDGRKLNGKPTKKGLYIYNGKKVAIK